MSIGDTGEEWVIDAYGCDVESLKSERVLRTLLETILQEVGLHPLSEGVWFTFPGEGGVTGMIPLSESHLTVHTYPEHGIAAFNLYCCRASCAWPWSERLGQYLKAQKVVARHLRRGIGADATDSRADVTLGSLSHDA